MSSLFKSVPSVREICGKFGTHMTPGSKLWWASAAAIGGTAWLVFTWLRSTQRVSDVTKKCVFVTGCDSGFGQALAVRLDSIGVPVFAGCLTEVGAQELKDTCTANLRTVSLDVTDPESVRKAYEYVKENLPHGTVLWGVVNNAGIRGIGGPLEFVDRREFHDVMAVNFFGCVEVTSSFLPLIKNSKGRIVNICSMGSFIPYHHVYPYTTSKFAVYGFTNALRLERKPWGIKVSSLEPGRFMTGLLNSEMIKRRMTAQWHSLPEELRQEFGEEYLEQTLASFSTKVMSDAKPDLSPVVDCYEHALFARHPQNRYLPGLDAKAMWIVSRLPEFLQEFILERMLRGPTPNSLKAY